MVEVEVEAEGRGCAACVIVEVERAGDGDVRTSVIVTTAADIQGLCTFIRLYVLYRECKLGRATGGGRFRRTFSGPRCWFVALALALLWWLGRGRGLNAVCLLTTIVA